MTRNWPVDMTVDEIKELRARTAEYLRPALDAIQNTFLAPVTPKVQAELDAHLLSILPDTLDVRTKAFILANADDYRMRMFRDGEVLITRNPHRFVDPVP